MDKLRVKTPLGTLVAYPSADPDHPGIWIDLENNGVMTSLSGTEYQAKDGGDPKYDKKLATIVWANGDEEDYTHHLIHKLKTET